MPVPKPAPGVARRTKRLAPSGGGVKGKLKRLMGKKVAGVPVPVIAAVLGIGAILYLRSRSKETDTDYDETAADLSGGLGDEGAITGGFGPAGGGGVIGLPGEADQPYDQPFDFLPQIFEIPRGTQGRRRPRGGSRERVNTAALREARRRAIERYKREQKERRQIIRRRIEKQQQERRELRQRLEGKRIKHQAPGGKDRMSRPMQGHFGGGIPNRGGVPKGARTLDDRVRRRDRVRGQR